MRSARKGDLAIVIGNYHDGGIIGNVVEVTSDPQYQGSLFCYGCVAGHFPNASCNLVAWRDIRGWIPTRWLVPLPAEDATREREAEKETAA